jgi:hypothetical protein
LLLFILFFNFSFSLFLSFSFLLIGNNLLLTYLLTYSFTHSHSLHGAGYYLKRWLSLSPSKNVLLYGTRRFIAVFTKAHHCTLSSANQSQFAP